MSIFKIIIFIVIAVALIFTGRAYSRWLDEKASQEEVVNQQKATEEKTKIMEQLIKEDVVMGTGAEAKVGDAVSVNYVGTLENGTKFDSSYDRKQPFEFTLGVGKVIQGWDIGVVGMKVGGKRNLTIPPQLGYGDRANGPIPANSTLKFTVELLSVK